MNVLKGVDGLSFRRLPDAEGNSGAFISFFMPTEAMARDAAKAFGEAGIGGNFYWYDNNWHYIRKWQHLLNMSSMHRMPEEVKSQAMQQVNRAFAASDAIMCRCISSSISLLWSEEQALDRGQKIAAVLNKVIAAHMVTV